jgi:ABC-2 type transport system permease protein
MDLMFMTRDLKLVLTYYISDVISNTASVAATLLLAERFDGIGAWTKFQIVFMLGYATAVSGIMWTFFNYNALHISRRLGRGQLDHTLIQPQPIWMALLTEGFTPFSSSAILIPGFMLMIWATVKLSLAVTPAWLAMVALNLIASGAAVLAFSFIWGSMAFWAPRAAEEISSSAVIMLFQLKSFPLDGLGPALLWGLTTALPVGFVAWYPCRYLLGVDGSRWGGLATPLAAALLSTLAAWAFIRGMKHYGKSGSQRYSSFGHRR